MKDPDQDNQYKERTLKKKKKKIFKGKKFKKKKPMGSAFRSIRKGCFNLKPVTE